jgi:hypothetical protein
MRISLSLLVLSLLLSLSCRDDGQGPFDALRNCCENPHLEENVGQGRIFVPNVFSPNGDGINDILYVHASADIERVVSFVVNRGIQAAFFVAEDIQPNDPSAGWNGLDQFETALQGQVDLEITVIDVNGVEATFSHQVCVIADSPIPCLDQSEQCVWPSQFNGQGGYDPNLPPLETCE